MSNKFAGVWIYDNKKSIVIGENNNSVIANWLSPDASWKSSCGTVNGAHVTMSFDNGVSVSGTLQGNCINWNNNTRWTRSASL